MAMLTQIVRLDMRPQKNPPHVQVTEYDKGSDGWLLRFDLYYDGRPISLPDGVTAKVEGTTKAGSGFSQPADTVNNDPGRVFVELSEDMTAYKGAAWCKLVLSKNGSVINASGFWLDVDRAGVEADTVIGAPGFTDAIDQAAARWLVEHASPQILQAVADYMSEHGEEMLSGLSPGLSVTVDADGILHIATTVADGESEVF